MDIGRLPAGIHPSALLRQCTRRVLVGEGARELLLDGLRLVPPSLARVPPPADVAAALGPYARLLWRRRAALLLARALPAALASIVALNLLRLTLFAALPRWTCWSLAAVPLLLGLWAALCQRPTLGETARLLDRRFGLRESLGTAVEAGVVVAGSLGERQRMHALSTLNRLPARPWGGSLGGRGRAILPALAALALGCTLAGATHQDTRLIAASGGTTRPLGVAQVPAQPSGPVAGRGGVPALAGQRPKQANAGSTRPDPFASNFQMHAAPAGASLPAGSTASGAPGLVALDGSAGSSGGQAGGASAALSGTARNAAGRQGGKPSGASGKPGGQGKGGPSGLGGQSPQNQAQGGQQGSGQGSGSQQGANSSAAQQGVQGGQVGAAPQPGTGQPPSSANGQGGAQGANPFGQDARPPVPQGRGRGQAGGRPGRNSRSTAPQPAARRGAQTAKGAHGAGRQTGQMAPGGQDGADPTRRGRGASPSGPAQRNAPAPGQARAAQGRELDLGGQAISGQRGQGAQLVRVLPQSSVPLPGAAGSAQTGPTTVQGYVPEDNSDLSPEEQALLKVYFANGGGS